MLTACGGNDSTDKNNIKYEGKLQIVSTIKPIQAIVLAIVGEYAQSEQLIPDHASPHNYSFKPSDIRKVNSADVVFRIDEHMEKQLNAVFGSLNSSTLLVSLAEIKGMKLLEANDPHHEDEHGSDSSHDDHENVDVENVDFHIWTSPKNAMIIASTVTRTLSDLDTKNSKHYQQNFEIFSESLKEESKKISTALSKYQNSAYVVFHNSWQYFANEFRLQKPIVIDLHEGVSSGAKTVREIRNIIENENIQCVFYDASVSEARLKLLTGKIKATKIDVLAQAIEINQSAYFNWLHQLGEQVESCLSR